MMVMALVLIMDMGISSNVLYHCGGNPLYVKAICGLLCHAKSVLQELDNLKEAFSPDFKIFCDILPQHLKLCLTLCSDISKLGYVCLRASSSVGNLGT